MVAVLALIVPSVVCAETVEEQRKTADENRAKLAVYAATVDAVRSGQLVGLMPAHIVDAAAKLAKDDQGWGTSYRSEKMGDNVVSLSMVKDVITFKIDVEASWKVNDSASGYHIEGDPIDARVSYIIMVKKFGIVFYKDREGDSETIHSAPASWGTIIYGGHKIMSVMLDYCDMPSLSSIGHDNEGKMEILKSIIKSYGQDGILSRVAMKQWYNKATEQIYELQKQKDRGYIVYIGGQFCFAKPKKKYP